MEPSRFDFRPPPAVGDIKRKAVHRNSDVTMLTDVEDNSWEEVYRANGVRCDIEDVSSPCEAGVCPTPPANSLTLFTFERERNSIPFTAPLEAFV